MKRFSVPILFWVVSGLTLVALVPIGAAWFQTERNIDSIIGQTQQTHQIIARSTADRLAGRLKVLIGVLEAAADDPNIYLDPSAEQAQHALAGIVSRTQNVLSLSLYARRGTENILVFAARRPDSQLPADLAVNTNPDAPPRLFASGGRYYLRLQKPTTRPDVFLHMLVSMESLEAVLNPGELGDEARILLVDMVSGKTLYGPQESLDRIPATMRKAIEMEQVDAANNSHQQGRRPIVYGFARVAGLPLKVVSIQPARRAEQARADMAKTARLTFVGVIVVVALLSLGAWGLVVNPIRSLIGRQQGLLGGHSVEGHGSEIAQLQDGFAQLEAAIRERDQISQILIGRYQIVRRIGSGAMGTVYLGWDPALERDVALKTIRFKEELSDHERTEMTEALFNEARAAGRLHHPNLVTVYDVLGDSNGALIAMEYVEGNSLDQRIRDLGPQSWDMTETIARGMLRGLVKAHGKQVIHRDLKPGNVLLGVDGDVKISDFGIAGFLSRGAGKENAVMGTPGYIAPESYNTGEYGPKTDLFAVGVVLIECLTGHTAFAGRNTAQVIARTQSKDLLLPASVAVQVPESGRRLIDGLLEKNPDQRIATAMEALNILDQNSNDEDTDPSDIDKETADAKIEAVDMDFDSLPTRIGRNSDS